MNIANLPDSELLSGIQAGDGERFKVFFDRYWQLLWKIAARKTGDPSDAEDLVQELFVEIWNRKQPIQLTTSLQTYLVSCLYLKLFKYFRQKGFRQKHEDHFAAFVLHLQEAGMPGSVTNEEFEEEYAKLCDVIDQVVQLMPPQMKTAFSLKYQQGLTTAQIADQMQVSTETVKTHLKLAVAKLRKAGEEYPGALVLLPGVLEMLNASY